MRNTGHAIQWNGNLFAVCEHEGRFYLYDPGRLIPSPDRGAGLMGCHGAGLGDATQAAWATANVALNFVPVVGNILSAVSSIAQVIFGGGDPTPISTVWKAVIDAREQLAAARNAYYGPGTDYFTVDPSLDRTSDGDYPSGGALAAQVTAEIQQLPSADRHKVKRDSEYAAIKNMQGQIQQIADALKTKSVAAQVAASFFPAAAAVAPAGIAVQAGTPAAAGGAVQAGTPAPAGAIAAQSFDYSKWLPWLLPIGALLLYSQA